MDTDSRLERLESIVLDRPEKKTQGPRRRDEDGGPEQGPFQCAMRQNARGALEQEIGNLRDKADMLKELLDSLPAVLSPRADEALWGLIKSIRRP